MPPGKVRSNKRSSSNSYSSAVTTIVFIGLCILVVWMLSSNSVIPPKSTARTASTASIRPSSIADSHKNRGAEPKIKKKQPVFHDSQDDLPDDAIKSDEGNHDDHKDESSEVSSDSDVEESSSETSSEVENDHNDNQDIGQEKKLSESNADDKKERDPDVEENPQESPGKESSEEFEQQKKSETQVTEESFLTQNQEAEESREENRRDSPHNDSRGNENQQGIDDQDRNEAEEDPKDEQVENQENVQQTDHEISDEDQQNQLEQHQKQQDEAEEAKVQEVSSKNEQAENHENGDRNDHEIPDDDQQKRLEQHQKQDDDQMRQGQSQEETHGATNSDQIEHDEAPAFSSDDQMLQNAMEDRKARTDNQANEHEVLHSENTSGTMSNQETDQKDKPSKPNIEDSFPNGESSGIPQESKESKHSWTTQANQSDNQKERRKVGKEDQDDSIHSYKWQLCNVTAGPDYIPCLDNEKSIAKLHSRSNYEHRERHCPEEPPTCLVSLPEGYKKPIEWPQSRDKIWYYNVPHTKLAEVKGHQNWVKVTGEFLTFPGGGTQFIHGAMHYIDFVQEAVPDIAWGKHTRVILDVGCGVASFGGYLFEKDALAMSFAPKDEHEAQVQFALERGIPAISAVMGTQRLPFPSNVFDLVHCARCRVPWHARGGALLLELNRVLRPGGHFVWSATPVYQTLEEDVQIWKEMSKLTVSMCWELIAIRKDKLNSIGAAIYRKPNSNECYNKRKYNQPPMCKSDDDPNASWYVPLQACIHRVPTQKNERGSEWPVEWPHRLQTPPNWLNRSQMGIYGKPAPKDFAADYEHWKRVVSKSYLSGLGISWSDVRNIMDMRAVYGGFAAALKDLKVWVLNVVNVDSPDTLPIIFERGLFGIYHDWCESFSTYPRTYDLLHADHLFSRLKKRCKIESVMAEVDRIVRPGGKLIVRDDSSIIGEVENLLKSLHWDVHLTFSKNKNGILSAQKSNWRPDSYSVPF